jgi:hypothetical protein
MLAQPEINVAPDGAMSFAARMTHWDRVGAGLASYRAAAVIERARLDDDASLAQRFIDRLPNGYAQDTDLAQAVEHIKALLARRAPGEVAA